MSTEISPEFQTALVGAVVLAGAAALGLFAGWLIVHGAARVIGNGGGDSAARLRRPVMLFVPALTCLLAKGHLLIEDIPGIGKTTLAKVLSRCLGLNFRRIQCTSDMLPKKLVPGVWRVKL